jgi:hypothetical protein
MAINAPIALNIADRQAVRSVIVPRCTGHVTNYALYILGGGGNPAPTTGQTNWAASAIRNPATVGEAVSWHVLNQPSYINGGSSIADDELQGIVETAIRNHFVTEPPAE